MCQSRRHVEAAAQLSVRSVGRTLTRSGGAQTEVLRMQRFLCLAMVLSLVSSCASSPNSASPVSGVVAPRVVKRVEPQYPQQLRAEGVEGVVEIAGVVPKEGGALRNPRVIRSDDPRLNQLALDAIARWTWSPGFQDGQAVDVEFSTSVRFSLQR